MVKTPALKRLTLAMFPEARISRFVLAVDTAPVVSLVPSNVTHALIPKTGADPVEFVKLVAVVAVVALPDSAPTNVVAVRAFVFAL
jgi:hypothetical protein